jgi:hypothetical protein
VTCLSDLPLRPACAIGAPLAHNMGAQYRRI